MDGLEKELDVALKSQAAENAAAEVRRQVESQGLALPNVTPLVLDFGLGDFHSLGEVEYWIAA